MEKSKKYTKQKSLNSKSKSSQGSVAKESQAKLVAYKEISNVKVDFSETKKIFKEEYSKNMVITDKHFEELNAFFKKNNNLIAYNKDIRNEFADKTALIQELFTIIFAREDFQFSKIPNEKLKEFKEMKLNLISKYLIFIHNIMTDNEQIVKSRIFEIHF